MAGTITGRVVDAAGRPVAGVPVAVVQGTQPHRDIAAITGADGAFRLHGLRPGSYLLMAGGNAGSTVRVALTGTSASVEIRIG